MYFKKAKTKKREVEVEAKTEAGPVGQADQADQVDLEAAVLHRSLAGAAH